VTAYEKAQQRIRARPRTWLVTGAAGFIGSHLAEALLRLDQAVVGLDNFATGSRENLRLVRDAVGGGRWSRLRFIEGDIRSLETCRAACRDADLALHQAALGSVPRSIDDPLASHEANVNGFLNLLLAARDAGLPRLVYASSSAVYGDHPALPKSEPQIGRAVSPYGLTKHVNELYAGVFARCYGSGAIGLRYFNVFGPRQDADGAYPSVIPAWLGALARGETPGIYGDGEAARDFCHVDNVVQANLLAATVEDPAALDRAYNVALGEQTSLNQLFALMRELLAGRLPRARSAQPAYREPRRGDVRLSRADIGAARELLGYEPQVRVREGLQSTIDWYLQHLLPEAAKRRAAANV